DDFLRAPGHEELDCVLVGEEVGSLDRVQGVELEGIVIAEHGRGPTLRGHRMTPHGIDLRDEGDRQLRIRFRGGDGGAKTRRPSTDDDDVEGGPFHGVRKSGGRISFWNVPRKPRVSRGIDSNRIGRISPEEGLVSSVAGLDASTCAEPSSSPVDLGALHGGRTRRGPWENLPRRDEGPRGHLLLDPKGRDLLLARPQRRGEDDAPTNSRYTTEADGRPGVRPRPRRPAGSEGDPSAHRGRPARGQAADAPVAVRSHPLLLPDPRPL